MILYRTARMPMLLAALAIGLAACSNNDSEPQPQANEGGAETLNIALPEEPVAEPVIENIAVENKVTENVAIGLDDEEQFSADQQMLEDAAATGLTSRVPDEDPVPAAANGASAPAE